jgi:hypothetical protein
MQTQLATTRDFASRFFNETWELLAQTDRTADEDVMMIHLAHGSRAHWRVAGGPKEWAISEWQISRVYAELNRAEPAVFHARQAIALAGGGQLGLALSASAHEGLARALRVAGEDEAAQIAADHAAMLLLQIKNEEDHDYVVDDLADHARLVARRDT